MITSTLLCCSCCMCPDRASNWPKSTKGDCKISGSVFWDKVLGGKYHCLKGKTILKLPLCLFVLYTLSLLPFAWFVNVPSFSSPEVCLFTVFFFRLCSLSLSERIDIQRKFFLIVYCLWTSSYMSCNAIACAHTHIIDAHLTLLQCTCSKVFVTDMEFSFVLLCLTLIDSVTPVSSAAQVKPIFSILEIFTFLIEFRSYTASQVFY